MNQNEKLLDYHNGGGPRVTSKYLALALWLQSCIFSTGEEQELKAAKSCFWSECLKAAGENVPRLQSVPLKMVAVLFDLQQMHRRMKHRRRARSGV